MTTIWVTGARGFLGRYLVRNLASAGHVIGGIGHGHVPPEVATAEGLAGWVNAGIHSGSLDSLRDGMGKPQVILHLAGGSAVGPSIGNPLEDFERTVSTVARLLDWVHRSCPECAVIGVSSAATYGSGHIAPIREDAAGMPYSPYGFHKSMMESVCRSYGQSFGLRTAIVRVFSAYGVGLRKQLLWDVCTRLARGGSLQLDGTGEELRDWIEARDVARLLTMVSESLPTSSTPIVNGGTGVGHSVKEIVNLVMDAWGESRDIWFSGRSRPGDPKYLVADVTRLQSLGFVSEIGLTQGVRAYVEWFRELHGC